ncbi:MAG: metallophosphoesterase family protein [Proteobacteria bacterium]|nr:metallophosphoesterase family protein [Pseudomonadota bacterium]
MKIGLISDVHATVEPLREALTLFRQNHVDTTICVGDIAGYGEELDQTVKVLIESKCQTISGNHDIWYLSASVPEEKKWIKDFFSTLPATLDFSAEGKQINVVHASPPDSNMKGIKLLDEHGEIMPDRKAQWSKNLEKFDYDVLIVGHTHQVFAERLGNILIINPGSTKFNHTCAILTLPELTVQVFPLSNKEPLKTWNWSQMEQMYEND